MILMLTLFFVSMPSLPVSMGVVEYPPALGPQNVVVITVEFSDEKPQYYPPVSQIEEVLFGMVNDYYTEVSYNQMFFKGYVTEKFYQIGAMEDYKWPWVEIVADAILAADGEVDYSSYRHVIVLLIIPHKYHWWATPGIYTYPWDDLQVVTDDGVTVEEAILLQGHDITEEPLKGWVNIRPLQCWIHELGHGLGLPDDSNYFGLDSFDAGMLVHMLAWNKIALGWIAPDKIVEVPLGNTTRVVLDPIENDTTGTLIVKIVKDPESYWLVEARRPIGYDSDLPTMVATSLDTVVEAIGHPPIEGVLITRVEHPSSATPPVWEGVRIHWTSELLNIGSGETAIFVDAQENLLIAVIDEDGSSFVLEVTTAESALEIQGLLYEVKQGIQAAEFRGLESEQAQGELDEAGEKYNLAFQSYRQYDFEAARSFAQEALHLIDHASLPIASAGSDLIITETQNITVIFDAGGSSDIIGITSYEWDFGDGTNGFGLTAAHIFVELGNYTVTLMVKDAAGNIVSDTLVIAVLRDTDGDKIPDATDPDDDGDGMTDPWETANGLDSIDGADASHDNDGDGLTNLQEYQGGTDPNNYFSPFPLWIIGVAVAGVGVVIAVYIVKVKKQ